MLDSPEVLDTCKDKLRAVLASLDPLRLLDEIRAMQEHIAGLAAGSDASRPPEPDADLEHFLAGLATAWRDGEVRPTRKPKPQIARWWRTRDDVFQEAWPGILVSLESEPDQTAKEIMERLCADEPSVFRPSQLRTLQRRVKQWRVVAARRLVFPGTTSLGPEDPAMAVTA